MKINSFSLLSTSDGLMVEYWTLIYNVPGSIPGPDNWEIFIIFDGWALQVNGTEINQKTIENIETRNISILSLLFK